MKHLLFFLLCSSSFIIRSQTNYYVAVAGNDSAAGTISQPFASIARLNQIIFKPGDSILFEANEQFNGELILNDADSSLPAKPIYIGSYGEGRATIIAGSANGILVNNLSGIVISKINVTTPNISQNNGFGIKVYNDKPHTGMLSDVRISYVEASNFKWAGIYVGGIPIDLPGFPSVNGCRYGFKNVVVDSCLAHHNMYYGIYVSGSWWTGSRDYANADITVRNSIAHDNAGDSTYTNNHSGSGIMIDDAYKVLIEYCVSYHNGYNNAGIYGGPCGIWIHCTNKGLIQYCESYNNKTGGAADGGGFDMDGGVTNSIIQFCYSHDNDGPGYLMWNYDQAPHKLSGNTVRYSISANDCRKHAYGAIHIGTSGQPITNIQVYQNTFIVNKTAGASPKGVWVGGWNYNDEIHFYNNLIIANDSIPLLEIEKGQKNILFAGNAYWSNKRQFIANYDAQNFTSLASFRKDANQEKFMNMSFGVFADPRFTLPPQIKTVGDPHSFSSFYLYKLHSASPLRTKGIELGFAGIRIPGVDFRGFVVPTRGAPDIGAYQFSKSIGISGSGIGRDR